MTDTTADRVSELAERASRHDGAALAELMPLVYDELRRLARGYLGRERRAFTLQPTALVNEAYLRLLKDRKQDWRTRAQVIGIAAMSMRQILIEAARARAAQKRGGELARVTLDEGLVADESRTVDVLAVDDALHRLAAIDAEQARLVELRFFGGLTVEESAAALGISPATVKRHWAVARAWLQREITAWPSLMDAERWRRINDLFHAALERDPGSRGAFIDEACAGDPALRTEVLELLQMHSGPGAIDRPAVEADPGLLLTGDDDPLIGRRLGPYEVTGLLGRGGMGIVYLGQDTRLQRPVAIKALPPALTDNDHLRARLRREAMAAGALSHPCIATVFALEEFDGQLYVVQEYIPGRTLRATMKIRAGRMAVAEIVSIALDIARALAAAHAQGVLHRDLKPENVLHTPDGGIKVVDFGLARFEPGAVIGNAETLTRPGALPGTPGYMAPEVVRGDPVDARADQFSFGVLLYELVAGKHPFEGTDDITTVARILETEPSGPGPARPEYPEPLVRVITTCLAKAPRDRYRTTSGAGHRARSGAGCGRGRIVARARHARTIRSIERAAPFERRGGRQRLAGRVRIPKAAGRRRHRKGRRHRQPALVVAVPPGGGERRLRRDAVSRVAGAGVAAGALGAGDVHDRGRGGRRRCQPAAAPLVHGACLPRPARRPASRVGPVEAPARHRVRGAAAVRSSDHRPRSPSLGRVLHRHGHLQRPQRAGDGAGHYPGRVS